MDTVSPPTLVPRRIVARVVIALVSPVPLLLVAGGLAEWGHDPTLGAALAALGLVPLLLLAFAFAYEQTHRVWLGADGVEVRALGLRGLRRTAIRFDDVEQLYLRARNTTGGAGGSVGLVGALFDRLTRPKDGGINENTTSIAVSVVGGGKRLKLTNGTRDVLRIYRALVDATQPRLHAAATRALGQGATVPFGPIVLGAEGVRVGKSNIAYGALKDFVLEDGRVRIKEDGAWFSQAKPPVAKVPNVDTLLALVADKRGWSQGPASSWSAAARE